MALVGPGVIGARTSSPSPRRNASSSCDIASPSASTTLATYGRQRNMSPLRRRAPPRGLRPPDIIAHTQTLAAPGAQEPLPPWDTRLMRPIVSPKKRYVGTLPQAQCPPASISS